MNLRFPMCDKRASAAAMAAWPTGPAAGRPRAFTIAELLVVMGIIIVLAGILIPVVSRVRDSAKAADTQNMISILSAAIQSYQNDHRSLPGPLHNDEIADPAYTIPVESGAAGFEEPADVGGVTMAENLVLGLLGGLRLNDAGNLIYDPSAVGQGPSALGGTPKKGTPYIDSINLSWRDTAAGKTGRFELEGLMANDTIIPEFLDRFTDPLPILYLRARLGAPGIIGEDEGLQYDLEQFVAYTGVPIGTNREYPNHGLTALGGIADPIADDQPNDAVPYFAHPTLNGPTATYDTGLPRQKDSFILISAGKDRTYGTTDDITNFGSVIP